jgi:hypothetical protein
VMICIDVPQMSVVVAPLIYVVVITLCVRDWLPHNGAG